MNNDIALAFGPLTALIAQRKRALARYEEAKHFRWHAERHRKELLMLGVDIRFAFFIPAHA